MLFIGNFLSDSAVRVGHHIRSVNFRHASYNERQMFWQTLHYAIVGIYLLAPVAAVVVDAMCVWPEQYGKPPVNGRSAWSSRASSSARRWRCCIRLRSKAGSRWSGDAGVVFRDQLAADPAIV